MKLQQFTTLKKSDLIDVLYTVNGISNEPKIDVPCELIINLNFSMLSYSYITLSEFVKFAFTTC